MRLIGEAGQQLGILPLEEALNLAKERGLDLIEISEKANPPVCRIIDSGKYLYQIEKKARDQKTRKSEVKGIRLGFATAKHDLKLKAKQAETFLKEGHKVKIELILRGRQKIHKDIAEEKIKELLSFIPLETTIERQLKSPRGPIVVITARKKI